MDDRLFDLWGVRRAADCGHNTCVANVAALLKNREENGCHWTAKSIQHEFGLVREANGKSNVPNMDMALSYLENATDRRKSKTSANFQDARVIGDYAIFLNAHVVYGIIEAGSEVAVLDANVGRGFVGWNSFVEYAKSNMTLYGPEPGRLNRAYRLVPIDD